MPRMDIQALIDLAGGVQEAAKMLGVHRTTVLGWRQAGAIPASRAVQVMETFGLKLPEAAELFNGPRKKSEAA